MKEDFLAKGLHEVCKAIEGKKAKFCILAKDVDEKNYDKLVRSLCKDNEVPIITVEKATDMGEWIGICKYDMNKKIRKPRKCSSVVIKAISREIKEDEIKLVEANYGK